MAGHTKWPAPYSMASMSAARKPWASVKAVRDSRPCQRDADTWQSHCGTWRAAQLLYPGTGSPESSCLPAKQERSAQHVSHALQRLPSPQWHCSLGREEKLACCRAGCTDHSDASITGFILIMGKGVMTFASVHQGLHETGMLTAVMQAGMLLCSVASLSLH